MSLCFACCLKLGAGASSLCDAGRLDGAGGRPLPAGAHSALSAILVSSSFCCCCFVVVVVVAVDASF
jgi:hypothetical protein